MAGNYGILFKRVQQGAQNQAGLLLASIFDLQPSKMKQIINAGEIILLDNLSKSQADNLLNLFKETTEGLAEFVVFQESNRPASPKVNWPASLKINGKAISEFDTADDNECFVCPHCGKFVMVVLKKPEDDTSGETVPDGTVSEPVPNISQGEVDTLEPIEEENLGDLEEAVPVDEQAMKLSEDAAHALEAEVPVEEFEQGLSNTGSKLEAVEEDIPQAPEVTEESELADIPEAPEAAELEEIPEDEDGDCSVYLGRLNSKIKKEAAVEILCELKDITPQEAASMINKPITAVAKRVSENIAEDIKQKFADKNISVRIKR